MMPRDGGTPAEPDPEPRGSAEPTAVEPSAGQPVEPRPRGNTPFVLARTLVRQAERAMVRASDSVLIRGNSARLLVDGPAAFDAWLEAIAAARHWVHLENYIIRDDRTGRRFREALVERARAGVAVRVLYDWLGCWATPARFWAPMREAGAEVRSFAPPSVRDPLSMMRRDHRKVLTVDGSYASVAGMCIGDEWAGTPEEGIPPWRDTGVEMYGPVAAVVDRAFARSWDAAGPPLPLEEVPDPELVGRAGDVSVRVVEGEPGRSRIYRLSQFVAVGVERRLWITDPYFVTPPAMTESLAAAARDGVDVRIIVPAYNNWPIVGGFSRAGYRPLLEAGVRLFEWEGPMIHAKTAVADGIWSRVGSSNLNLASLLGNWELDVAILDRGVARQMEELFLRDMHYAVEVMLDRAATGWRGSRALARRPVVEKPGEEDARDVAAAREARRRAPRGSRPGRFIGRVARAGSVLARALVGPRLVGREDSGWITAIALALLALAVAGFLEPRLLAWPIAFLLFWLGLTSLFRAWPRRDED
jgi:cardiolipin synthase A/B